MRKVEREEIERGTGTGGNPALVAVDGKVYDVSKSEMWPAGRHMNTHSAGRDLSKEIIAAPHGKDVLERFVVVGEMDGERPEPSPKAGPPALVSMVLARHPHPVSVHFPIALSVAGAVFTVIGIGIGSEAVETAGFLNLVLGAVMAPPAIAAGLLSWKYNYGSAWTPIFRRKIALSVVYLAVAGAAIAARLLGDGMWAWAYAGLAAALPLVALGLGFLGGRITFPS